MSEIKAIETYYSGYRFRSRLEARWAVFFDAIKIRYQYEPEGFVGLDEICYLPDFYFPEFKTYAEVKGSDELLKRDARKITAAIDFDATPVSEGLIILGDIPNPESISWGNIPIFHYLRCHKGILDDCAAFINGFGKRILLGRNAILDEVFSIRGNGYCVADYYGDSGNLPKDTSTNCMWSYQELTSRDFAPLAEAYRKARQARFEHGETPTPF